MIDDAKRRTQFIDLGLIDFKAAWDYQTRLFDENLAIKAANRVEGTERRETRNYLIFCEHPHVFTLGKSGNPDNLKIPVSRLTEFGAAYYPINRGGDITYHGPGQLVAYPIFDLERFFTDIHLYMRTLEEAVIRTCADLGVPAGRMKGLTGVWIEPDSEANARKICALGVKSSRWVTMHGLAFNVNTDLSYFDHIVPCGIEDKGVTSLARELGAPQDPVRVSALLRAHLQAVFELTFV